MAPNGEREFFSVFLTDEQCVALGYGAKKQIIFEAETLSAILGVLLWDCHVKDSRCLLFVDNDACKFSLLKGTSDNFVADKLAETFVNAESSTHSYTWICRVPSASNIADAPSRGVIDALLNRGFVDRSKDAKLLLVDILASLKLGVS